MSPEQERLNQLIRAARRKIQSGKREEALHDFKTALELDPDNKEINAEISTLEREIAAMKAFRRSRSRRGTAPDSSPTATSPESFVQQCLERSRTALEEGNEVRSLQELERAQRQEPDNREVRRQIKLVKRTIKVNNLIDLAYRKINNGDLIGAFEHAQKIFIFWPGSPDLENLISELEKLSVKVSTETKDIVEEIELEEEIEKEEIIEKIEEIEEIEEVEEVEVAGKTGEITEEPAVAEEIVHHEVDALVEEISADVEKEVPVDVEENREETVIASIREKISRSAFADAYQETEDASREFPGNNIINELLKKLEKLAGVPAEKPEPPAVKVKKKKPRPKKKPREEIPEEAEKKKKKLFLPIALFAAVVVSVVVVFVILPSTKEQPAPEIEVIIQPYRIALTVEDPPEGTTVMIDNQLIQPDSGGIYRLSSTEFGIHTLSVQAEGYEVKNIELEFTEGQEFRETQLLQPIGSSEVLVSFEVVVPEGGEPPEGSVSYFVNSIEIDPDSILTLMTGTYVFYAELEGYEPVPETVFVNAAGVLHQQLLLRSPDTAEIRLALAGNITGNADFYINGDLIAGNARSVTHIAPFGSYTCLVRMDDREDWVRSITLEQDGYSATASPVEIDLTGRLIINPEPWANVTIDGSGHGATPLPPIELEEGDHTVVLSNPGYENQTHTVTITAGEDVSIRYTASSIEIEEIVEDVIIEEEPIISGFPISQPAPSPTQLAYDRGDVDGYVTIQVRVGPDGSVLEASIVNDEVGLGCGQAALDKVYQWQFSPATQGGVPVEWTTSVQIRFYVE